MGDPSFTFRAIHKILTWTAIAADALKIARCQWWSQKMKLENTFSSYARAYGAAKRQVDNGWSA